MISKGCCCIHSAIFCNFTSISIFGILIWYSTIGLLVWNDIFCLFTHSRFAFSKVKINLVLHFFPQNILTHHYSTASFLILLSIFSLSSRISVSNSSHFLPVTYTIIFMLISRTFPSLVFIILHTLQQLLYNHP